MIYYAEDTDGMLQFMSSVSALAISTNSINTERFITVQLTAGVPTFTDSNPLILNAKNAIAESHGVLGHHGTFTLTNDNTQAVELIALETEVMISKA